MLKRKKKVNLEEDHWLSVSDLMAGLMIVFLFIAIALMRDVVNIAKTYEEKQSALYQELYDEFKEDLKKWKADIDKDNLSITFKSPDTLFDVNDSKLKLEYKSILKDFFPRYLKIILKYKDSINEIRIEGHTSSPGGYFYNMKLSQERTRSVLEYIYYLDIVSDNQKWIRKHIAAIGLSSSKLIYKNGIEDKESSRRVSFRVVTNADKEISKIAKK